jgi:hypothetical protein
MTESYWEGKDTTLPHGRAPFMLHFAVWKFPGVQQVLASGSESLKSQPAEELEETCLLKAKSHYFPP